MLIRTYLNDCVFDNVSNFKDFLKVEVDLHNKHQS